MMIPTLRSLTTGLLLLACASLRAQPEITIEKIVDVLGGTKPIPIALNGFSGEVAAVLRFDLEVQGFKVVATEAAQYELSGSQGGNVQGRLTDRISQATLLAKGYTGGTLRRQAHALADDVVQTVTGRRGIGQTKIAFKVETSNTSEIYVADFDGFGAQAITRDNSLVAAPAWVPGRMALAYVSYKLGGADIFLHNLTDGQRSAIAQHPGSNISPAISPDGTRVAMILSKDGWTDLYVANLDGSGLLRLTRSPQDESSPCWSPDGRWICFAAKIGERRTLAKVPATGGEVQRIAVGGVPNPTEPDWSPDGKWLAFTSQTRSGFDICVVPAEGGEARPLVAGEDPSWAPNSRTLIFARRTGNQRALSLLDVFTKQVKDVARVSGSSSQPSWAR